jgi:hypothetical protein
MIAVTGESDAAIQTRWANSQNCAISSPSLRSVEGAYVPTEPLLDGAYQLPNVQRS